LKIIETKDGVIIEVFVKPNSPKFRILTDNDEITVYSTEEPAKGRVNKELLRELSRIFHAKVELISGSTSRQKRLLIRDSEASHIERVLANKS
jgi:uncharacterized protein